MLLAIDVGNTEIKLGVFEADRLATTWRWSTDRQRMADEYGAQLGWLLGQHELSYRAIDRTVISSVVPSLTDTFGQLIARYAGHEPLIVSAAINTGVALEVDNPIEVGGDRIANALAARALYGAPAVVVDFGTATNFDVVSEAGAFIGGSFAPGVLTAMEGLVSRAARLQRFDLVPPPRAIGTNTVMCLQSGTIFGYVALVEGLAARIIREMGGDPIVIGTGGLVDLIASQTKTITVTDRNLTLKGLRLLSELDGGAA